MYEKQIEQLVVLQHLDEEIEVLEMELERAPRELKELEDKHAAAMADREQITEKMGLLENQKKRLEGEIEDDTLKIKKSKNKLMMATNTREYHAMMREMDNMEKLNRLREEENMALSEELERQKATRDEMDETAGAMQTEVEELRSNLEARLKKANDQLEKLRKDRTKSGKSVPPPILSRYEFIRSRLKNPVIVPVMTGVCTGCNISIPPQTYNELQRGKQIHSCPNCQRLIYWEEHLPQANKEKQTAEAAK